MYDHKELIKIHHRQIEDIITQTISFRLRVWIFNKLIIKPQSNENSIQDARLMLRVGDLCQQSRRRYTLKPQFRRLNILVNMLMI